MQRDLSSLARYHVDADYRKSEFPITRSKCFLAHAAVSPLPRRVADAMQQYLLRASSEGQFGYLHNAAVAQCRSSLADMVGANAKDISISQSTSSALNIVANSIDWQRGDQVLVASFDFLSNITPWVSLRRRGVETIFYKLTKSGHIDLDDIRRNLTNRTRLVAVSTVNFLSGAQNDISGVSSILDGKQILLSVDAIQSLGVFPTTVDGVDFLSAGAQKWLLGPQGVGVLYVSPECRDQPNPPTVAWNNVSIEESGALKSHCDAREFESGTPNAVGIVGLEAALSLIGGIGVSAIAGHVDLLSTALKERLKKLGFLVQGGSNIVSFRSPVADNDDVYRALDSQGIVVSKRPDADGTMFLRAAPHFYNTVQDVDQLVDALSPLVAGTRSLHISGASE